MASVDAHPSHLWTGRILEYRPARCRGALRTDHSQTMGPSPDHPLYFRRPGTFPLLVAPHHGINGGAQGEAATRLGFPSPSKSPAAAALELSSVTRAGQMIKYGQIDPPSGTAAGSLGSPEGAILGPFVALPSSRGRPAHASRSFPPLKALLALSPAGLALLA